MYVCMYVCMCTYIYIYTYIYIQISPFEFGITVLLALANMNQASAQDLKALIFVDTLLAPWPAPLSVCTVNMWYSVHVTYVIYAIQVYNVTCDVQVQSR